LGIFSLKTKHLATLVQTTLPTKPQIQPICLGMNLQYWVIETVEFRLSNCQQQWKVIRYLNPYNIKLKLYTYAFELD
jgi:hypothetical protein